MPSQSLTEQEEVRSASIVGGAIVATIFGFFGWPIAKYADPELLSISGLALGVGVAAFWIESHTSDPRRWWIWITTIVAAIGLVGVGWCTSNAYEDARANELRCATLQADILSASPERSDGPAVFQAFDCVPRGTAQFSKRVVLP